jgi:hypothetical protein
MADIKLSGLQVAGIRAVDVMPASTTVVSGSGGDDIMTIMTVSVVAV